MSSGPVAPAFPAHLSRRQALTLATDIFERHGIDTARLDARFLLLDLAGLSPVDLTLRGEASLGEAAASAFGRGVERRLAGEPVARILGSWEFWGLPFALSPATLVPRPDTETLVEAALALAGDRSRALRLLDLGTGSGCILTALLSERPRARGVGVDLSAEALTTARANATTNGVGERALFLRGRWCAPLAGPFDLIVSNPPYIASGTVADLAREVREHDPRLALDGGADGLDAYRAIIGDVAARPGLLRPGGALLLEIGHDQAEAVAGLGREAGFAAADAVRDLAGHPRVVTLRPPFAATSPGDNARP